MSFFGYLDAGTGSLILQSIVGVLLGLGIFLKAFWGRIVGIFKKTDSGVKGKKAAAEAASPETKSSKSSK